MCTCSQFIVLQFLLSFWTNPPIERIVLINPNHLLTAYRICTNKQIHEFHRVKLITLVNERNIQTWLFIYLFSFPKQIERLHVYPDVKSDHENCAFFCELTNYSPIWTMVLTTYKRNYYFLQPLKGINCTKRFRTKNLRHRSISRNFHSNFFGFQTENCIIQFVGKHHFLANFLFRFCKKASRLTDQRNYRSHFLCKMQQEANLLSF